MVDGVFSSCMWTMAVITFQSVIAVMSAISNQECISNSQWLRSLNSKLLALRETQFLWELETQLQVFLVPVKSGGKYSKCAKLDQKLYLQVRTTFTHSPSSAYHISKR